jgi:LuxR family maltose regulon positive regulatory protein
MFYGGHGRSLDRWLQALGRDVYARHPPLAVIAGWIHLVNGRAAETDAMADIAERSTFEGAPGDGSASFESQRAMLRAIMARRGPADVLADAELAVSQERPESPWRVNALWLLGSARFLFGDLDGADAAFEAAMSSDATAPATKMVVLAWRASVAMSRNDWVAAAEYARLARAVRESEYLDENLPSLLVYAVGARVAIRRGDIATARDELARAQLLRPLAHYAAPWAAVQIHLELARAYLAISDPAGARTVVREAEQVLRRRPHLGTLTTELLALQQQLASASSTLSGSSALTNAELRVLPLLSTYLSFPEIGDRLGISRHTVKTHAMSIYGKLEASSRGEAVERAIELGLLEPFYGLSLARRPAST